MDLITELTRANHDPAVIAKVRALMEQSARAEQVLAKNSATLAQKDFKSKRPAHPPVNAA